MRYDENPQLNAFFEKMKGKEWREWTFEEWMELQRLKPLRRKNSLFLDRIIYNARTKPAIPQYAINMVLDEAKAEFPSWDKGFDGDEDDLLIAQEKWFKKWFGEQ